MDIIASNAAIWYVDRIIPHLTGASYIYPRGERLIEKGQNPAFSTRDWLEMNFKK
jgi:hypothetical protein